MSKHFSTWRVMVLSGEGRKTALQMFVREEKIKRGHATQPVRFRSVGTSELQTTKSEVCVWRFRGSFFPPQFLSVQSTRVDRRLAFLSGYTLTSSSSSPFCALRFLFHFYTKKKKKNEKREIKKCTRDVSGSQSDQINVVIWLLVNRGSDCCRLGFFLLAKTKQIIGSNLVDLFDYCSDFEAFPALLQPRMQIKITMVCGEII